MDIKRIAVFLCLGGMLAGCYGTRPPPPQRSFTPPPGLGHVAPGPAVIALPADLPGLLAAYERVLLAQSHQLPVQYARRYADGQMQSLTSLYAGRDDELKYELTKRLRAFTTWPSPSGTSAHTPVSAYPVDVAGEQGRDGK